MQFQSHPEVEIDGDFAWKKRRFSLEIAQMEVRYQIETFEASSPWSLSPIVTMSGEVLESDGHGGFRFQVFPEHSERGLHFEALLADSELLCRVRSDFTDSSFCQLFQAQSSVSVLPKFSRERESETLLVRPNDDRPAFKQQSIAQTLISPLQNDEFKRALRRLNSHLRKHGGAQATIKLRSLVPHQRDFLAHLLSSPLDVLKEDAKQTIRAHYATHKRRLSVQITALELPREPLGKWSALVGETSKGGGVLVAYELDGFSMIDRTLVG